MRDGVRGDGGLAGILKRVHRDRVQRTCNLEQSGRVRSRPVTVPNTGSVGTLCA